MKKRNLSTPEPPPIANECPPVWPLVIEDMKERNEEGVAKYGVPLQPHNGRKPLRDAYQEVLDMAAYIRQAIYEEENPDEASEELTAFLQRIVKERANQERKWGIQNHRSFAKGVKTTVRLARYYKIPAPDEAKELYEKRAKSGRVSWMDILLEEVTELMESSDDDELIEELIQVAAVAIAWAQCVARRRRRMMVENK